MLIGPVFTRELVTAPRRPRFFLAPAVYVGALLILTCTAWLLLIGTQQVRSVGDMARFGSTLFQFLSSLQLILAVFFSALAAASAVAQEKDRRTLILLLLTNLSNSELVLGKLLASLLSVLICGRGLAVFHADDAVRRLFTSTNSPRLSDNAAQHTGGRQRRFDDRAVARKNVSNFGVSRLGPRRAGCLGGRARQRRDSWRWHGAPRALARRAKSRPSFTRSRPTANRQQHVLPGSSVQFLFCF